MTVKEMHIDVEQGSQQVAANRGRTFLPDEIDWILNKIQDRFIASCLRPKADGSGGFELDQAGGDKIRRLVTINDTLVPYVDTADRYKVFLPANYRNLLSDWSYTRDLCNGTLLAVEATHTQYITRLPQPVSVLGAAPYYVSVILQMPGSNSVTIPTDLPLGHTYTGYPEVSDVSFIVPWILWKLNTVYYGRFDTYNYPRHYIDVRTTAPSGSILITVDGTTNTTEVTETRTLTYHTGASIRHNNRLVPSATIPSMNEAEFFKSSHYSPISELAGDTLLIHRDSSFIVSRAAISYIRKPQPISLSLNTDCELAEDTHRAICDLAIEYIKGTVQNVQGKELKTADIAQRVIL